jgi:hypothetical protein
MVERFQVLKIFEPGLNASAPNQYIALRGSMSKIVKVHVPSSFSQTSVQFTNCKPDNPQTFLDKKINMRARFHITFTGTSPAGKTLLQRGRDGVRYLPIHSIINNSFCKINDTQLTADIFQTLHPRSNYWKPSVDELNRTKASSAIKDNCQNFSDVYMTINSPLSGFGDSGLTSGKGRGVISDLNVISNSDTAAEIEFTVCEPLIMAPFIHDTNDTGGPLWNITSLEFMFNFLHNINRVWCHDDGTSANPGSIITNMNTRIEEFNLIMTYLSPPPDLLIPDICTRTYIDFDTQNTFIPALLPNQERIIDSQGMVFERVPQSVFIFARCDNNTLLDSTSNGIVSQTAITTPDTYCQISNISFTYKNHAALMSTLTHEELYDMCLQNGYNRDYQEFRGLANGTFNVGDTIGTSGSVLRIIFGQDIAAPGVVPGLGGPEGQANFRFTCRVKNVNQTKTLNITLYYIFLTEGVVQITPWRMDKFLAPIERLEDVDMAPVVDVPFSEYRDMMGGGFWDVIKKWGRNINNFLKKSKVISTVAKSIPHPSAQGIASAAQTLGYGDGGLLLDEGGIYASGGRNVSKKELRMIKQRRM